MWLCPLPERMRAATDSLKADAAEAAEAQAYAERSAESARGQAARAVETAKGMLTAERERADDAERALKEARTAAARRELELQKHVDELSAKLEQVRAKSVADAMSASASAVSAAASAAAAAAPTSLPARARISDAGKFKGPLTVEMLQEQLRRKDHELDSLEATVRELEAMRTSLADELVRAAQRDAASTTTGTWARTLAPVG